MQERIPVPEITTYHSVYNPSPDIYTGPDTVSFRGGELYKNWIANDFTLIEAPDGKWHAFGITHPAPPGFIDDFNYHGDVHEAENQLFHCVYDGTLKNLYAGGQFVDSEKILYPQQRGNERDSCWAPCVVERDGTYYLFYSPSPMRLAISLNLYNWEPKGIMFDGPTYMRDPFVFYEDGLYTMIYVTDHLYYRKSKDLLCWSEESLFQENPFSHRVSQESPYIMKRNGIYYLIWCIYDGQNGCYDNRTFVFASEKLTDFGKKTPLAMLKGHASEIVSQDGQDYLMSVYYPQNGLNMARVDWK